jgi:hypothetical protein
MWWVIMAQYEDHTNFSPIKVDICDGLIDKVHWALLFYKIHLKGRALLKAYKVHNSSIHWQCETLNTPFHVWHYCPNTCTTRGKAQHYPRSWSSDTMIKSIEPYSSTKCTLREEFCSRLIKLTTQVYLGNVELLTSVKVLIKWLN